MKKIKLFLGVVLFGAMSFGAFTAYDYATMSAEERFLLANIEALTQLEDPRDILVRDCNWCMGGNCNTVYNGIPHRNSNYVNKK